MLPLGYGLIIEQVFDVASACYIAAAQYPTILSTIITSRNFSIARAAQVQFAIGGTNLAAVPFGPCFEVGGVVECAAQPFWLACSVNADALEKVSAVVASPDLFGVPET